MKSRANWVKEQPFTSHLKIQNSIWLNLDIHGYEVYMEHQGDVGLKVDGFEICRQIRLEKDTPILMITAKKEDIDMICGLGLGADDL